MALALIRRLHSCMPASHTPLHQLGRDDLGNARYSMLVVCALRCSHGHVYCHQGIGEESKGHVMFVSVSTTTMNTHVRIHLVVEVSNTCGVQEQWLVKYQDLSRLHRAMMPAAYCLRCYPFLSCIAPGKCPPPPLSRARVSVSRCVVVDHVQLVEGDIFSHSQNRKYQVGRARALGIGQPRQSVRSSKTLRCTEYNEWPGSSDTGGESRQTQTGV